MRSSVEELLKEADSYDNDKKFMAASDLCQELVKGTQFDNATLEKICNVFIKHLDEPTSDIKGNAIRCLAKVVTKIPEHQVAEICTKLVQNLVKPQKEDSKNYDIYSTCLKTLINEVTEELADLMCRTLANAGLLNRTDFPQINEELIEITNQLIKRFTDFLIKNPNVLDRTKLSKELLNNIWSDRSTLRRRSSTCLGTLSLIIPQKDVVTIGETLFGQMKENASKKNLLYFTFALNSVAKNAANKLTPILSGLLKFITDDIENRLNEESDDLDFQNELIDYYLSIIENFVKKCHKEVAEFLPKFINNELPQLICYDPNNVINFNAKEKDMEVENQGDDEDEWGEDDFENEDSSWRVRRGAIRLTETLIKLRPELLREIANSVISNIVACFKDKDENIKLDVFSTLGNFLESITVSEKKTIEEDPQEEMLQDMMVLNRLKSSYVDISAIINDIVLRLCNLFKDPKSPLVPASVLFLNASRCISSNMMEEWPIVFATLNKNFSNKSSPAELRVNSLVTLRRLLRAQITKTHTNISSDYPAILEIIKDAINNSYFKITSEGFKVLSTFYKVLRPSLQDAPKNYEAYIKPIVPTVISRLQETDIDQEIKNSIISSVSFLISYFGDAIESDNLNLIFKNLLIKLKSEVTRVQTLKSLAGIPVAQLNLNITNELAALLCDIVQELCLLAQKQDRTLKLLSLEVMKNIIYLLKQKLPKDRQKDIVDVTCPYIEDKDFFLAQLALEVLGKIITLSPDAGFYKDAIGNCIKLTKSSLIQGNTTQRISEVFHLIGAHKLADNSTIFNSLTSDLNKNCLITAAKALAGFVSGVDETARQKFIQELLGKVSSSNENAFLKQVSLLAVAEIGKQISLSSNKELLDTILKIFQSKEEDTKYYAAVALGGISVGNIEFYLPIVLDLIKQNADYQYLLLTTLKEIICQSDKSVHQKLHKEKLIPFLFSFAEKSDESLNHIVSECIGRLCLADLKENAPLILQNIKSTSPQVKYTTAAAFKYFCTKTTPLESVNDLIPALFDLIYDKDYTVQKAALGSLNTIVYNIPRSTHFVDKAFLEALAGTCKFKPELVKEYELGPFKHKQDEGLPLRNAAFSFIDITLELLNDKIEFSYKIDQVEKGIEDPSDDIQIIAYQILTKLAALSPHALVSHLERLLEKFEGAFAKLLKALGSKQEGERANDCLRAFLRAHVAISKLPEAEEVARFRDFDAKVKANEKCKEFIQQLSATA
eukprot:CAMPEP_0176438094 /NCGR_PEP_ID=MMETSP0127-20121128/19061_1 /TAXON_ID=938130 /ORGANISM="Platyophrya macrostoma, Strain WH" /LENGTH=1232 /DNA_ID=CAMNT_0017821943 /DNA_START=32 /DNA_END=3730 /DNA_ORIENTATION=+